MGTKQYDSATDLITFSRASGGTALSKISYGNELVTNGTFDTNASGWLGNNSYYSPTIESQRLKVVTVASGQWNYAHTSVSGLTIGKMYRFQASSFVGTATRHRISLGTSSGNSVDIFSQGLGYNVNQTVDMTFPATTTVVYVSLQNTDGVTGSTTFFDNISIKEVLFDQADGTLQVFNYGNNIPRIEYDATGAVKGLLIEEARTNLQVHSGDFSNSAWSKASSTVDTSYVAPDGTSTASKLTGVGGAGATGLYDSNSQGTGMSLTCFMKAGSSGVYGWVEGIVGGTSPYGVFDLENGTVVHSRQCDASIESVGNGWFRCVLANTAHSISFFSAGASDNTYTNASPWGASSLTPGKFIYVWGAQLETGAFPTSYIPTTGAAATRARDLAEIPTSAFGYNNDKGTVVCEFDSASRDGSTIFTLVVGQAADGITAIIYPTNRVSYQVVTGGAVQVNLNFDAYATASQVSKVATVYAKDDFAAVLNGGAVATDTAGSVPLVSTLKLGVYWGAGGFFMSGHIKSIQYYPRRLTDTQLQELTT
jgi:hypothetical protein